MDYDDYRDVLRDLIIDQAGTPSELEETLEFYIEFPDAEALSSIPFVGLRLSPLENNGSTT